MSEKMSRATHKGTLRIADITIPCFVLEDGRRVISGRGLTRAIGMKGRGPGVSRIPTHAMFIDFIADDLKQAIDNPIYFSGYSPKSAPSDGYEATILLSLCEAILKARDEGKIKTQQEQRYAKAADTLVRAFAKVGIIALVDEATGYQAERDRYELQKILSAYITPELMPWTKRFPPEFYQQLFRLRKWQYRPLSIRRPKYVGYLTVKLVYDKLPHGVLDELRKKNPADETGRRKYKHHQFLTDDVGNPHLEKHLAVVTALMRISPNWGAFERNFNRNFPPAISQPELEFEKEDEAD